MLNFEWWSVHPEVKKTVELIQYLLKEYKARTS
jgi:hypothetical protein